MTQAAKQCREYIEGKWPTTPIGRFACRNTSSGGISQHSAYLGYDSNALDIFGPNKTNSPEDQAWIQRIVDDLLPNLDAWSGRKILWKDGGAHENHAHIDFYPMITEHKWCGADWTPTWEYSSGATIDTREPEPENGRWDGGVLEYRGILNVPDTQWAHDVCDWGIEVGLINVTDNNPDDWNRMTSDGRMWTFFFRYDQYLRRDS